MTRDYLVSNLRLRPNHAVKKIGSRLLSILESEIEQRGFQQARLKVVAENTAAHAFYQTRGWLEAGSFTHEQLDILMMSLYKSLYSHDNNSNPAS